MTATNLAEIQQPSKPADLANVPLSQIEEFLNRFPNLKHAFEREELAKTLNTILDPSWADSGTEAVDHFLIGIPYENPINDTGLYVMIMLQYKNLFGELLVLQALRRQKRKNGQP